MEKRLYDETLRLLQTTNLSVDEIGRKVGCSGRWIRKVRDGDIKDPGVNKIQRLHDFLSLSTAA